ncbi:hypothetical protein TSOC_012305 [Tetrabaena socialis]|uniref:Uncharacterized protein n=1 Tax=Tetrabaena socialis TaxID=47790 RepID=A0A2J7ZND6_9CHLO|nr:hypothetical protein TSOC_012305 [Tetrabaena socialis]|eukprot:PNH01768.1 hypothetical protein TSOC_012305 [Tetrabaena socialis]
MAMLYARLGSSWRVAPTGRGLAGLAPRLLSGRSAPPCSRTRARAETHQASEIARLTDDIVAAEGRLAAVFDRRPMPRASEVAAMRQEVSEMKAQLALVMGAAGPGAALDGPAPSDVELADRARQAFLEVERLLGQRSGGANSRDDEAAIAVLEAENERLRTEATALLMRQQQLEDLVAANIGAGAGSGGSSRTLPAPR